MADKLSLTSHVYSPTFIIASTRFMNSLTDEQREAFVEAGEAITDRAYQGAAEMEERAIAEMEKAGVEVNEVDFEAFQEATRPVYGVYTDTYGEEWIELIDAARTGS